MFLERLLDNNEPGYFYLHDDQSLGINRACCAVLQLSVSVRAQHYDMLLAAKIAQIRDTFQAKLGWLIGNMYGRVGTTEWNTEYPDNPVKDVARAVLDATLHSVRDEQIKEGIAELRKSHEFETKTPEEIFEHIRARNVLSRSKKFENRAIEVSKNVRLINLIQGRATSAIQEGDALKQSVMQLLFHAGIPKHIVDTLTDQLIEAVQMRIRSVMTDATLPGRNEVAESFIRGLLQDSQIATLLR